MSPKYRDITLRLASVRAVLGAHKRDVKRHMSDLRKSWHHQTACLFYEYPIPFTVADSHFKQKEVHVVADAPQNFDPKLTNTLYVTSQRGINSAHDHQKVGWSQWKAFRSDLRRPPYLPDDEDAKKSERVVWGAVIINSANFIVKAVTWLHTGSHSMFAESIHSLADTANQLILAVGMRKSLQGPNADHPYGYHPMRFIAPLISGVGIFCVGCGLSIYHGFEALMTKTPEPFMSPTWAYGILAFSFLTESATLAIALNALTRGAKKSKLKMSEYIKQNSDPGVIVVLLEDVAAVLGIGIAATCMALSNTHNTHVYDAVGSLMIGSLLGGVATFIIKKNTVALVGKSIPRDTLNNINRIIEKDVLIRAIHDVKATDLGNGVVRYKAEVDVDGRELAKKYLERINLTDLLEQIRQVKSEKDAESFVLAHGEGVVDLLGAEVDRIEKELRRNHPQVKHVDLEVL